MKRYPVRMSDELHAQLKQVAYETNSSINKLIVDAVENETYIKFLNKK
jgi:predicted HicB family RNase H-like nuclease